jgi:hypothetical protein
MFIEIGRDRRYRQFTKMLHRKQLVNGHTTVCGDDLTGNVG